MQLIRCLLSNFLSQHVSGIIMPIIRRIRQCPTVCDVLPECVGCSLHCLILLMMGIMMPETCWDRKFDNKHRISCILLVLSLHLMFRMHDHKNLKFEEYYVSLQLKLVSNVIKLSLKFHLCLLLVFHLSTLEAIFSWTFSWFLSWTSLCTRLETGVFWDVINCNMSTIWVKKYIERLFEKLSTQHWRIASRKGNGLNRTAVDETSNILLQFK